MPEPTNKLLVMLKEPGHQMPYFKTITLPAPISGEQVMQERARWVGKTGAEFNAEYPNALSKHWGTLVIEDIYGTDGAGSFF